MLQSRHSRLRFITRFVIKDNPNPDIKETCKEKNGRVKKCIRYRFRKVFIFCFLNARGFAPQFYINNTNIGNFVKVTLNKKGCIHTIFEDARKAEKVEAEANQKK